MTTNVTSACAQRWLRLWFSAQKHPAQGEKVRLGPAPLGTEQAAGQSEKTAVNEAGCPPASRLQPANKSVL